MPAIQFVTQTVCPLADYHPASTLRGVANTFGTGIYRDKTFEIHQCESCGLGITSPIPSEETFAALYSDRSSNDFQPDDSSLTSRLKSFFARKDARQFAKHTHAPKYILDYGCGNGEFAVALGSIYPEASSIGSDFHPAPPVMLSAPGRYMPIESLAEHTGRFDLIVARHVLEHTYNPVLTLQLMRSLLAPGGTLAIEVPCLLAGSSKLFGPRWGGYYAPYHPVHFTRKSLSLSLEQAGFADVEHGDAELPMMGRSIQNALNCEYNIGLFCLGAALHPLQKAMSIVFRNPTCLRAWARAYA